MSNECFRFFKCFKYVDKFDRILFRGCAANAKQYKTFCYSSWEIASGMRCAVGERRKWRGVLTLGEITICSKNVVKFLIIFFYSHLTLSECFQNSFPTSVTKVNVKMSSGLLHYTIITLRYNNNISYPFNAHEIFS